MSSIVTSKAPDFKAKTIMPDNTIAEMSLDDLRGGKYAILFFYPLDFTFVCPSEILAFDKKLDEFKKRNCQVIGCSVDSHYTHLAWKNTPVEKGGIGNIQYPLVSDLSKQIAEDYKVLFGNEVALRGLFLIDKDGITRHAVINDLPLGRNIDEAIRILDALQFHEKNGEVCPANWRDGEAGMEATPEGVAKYLSAHN